MCLRADQTDHFPVRVRAVRARARGVGGSALQHPHQLRGAKTAHDRAYLPSSTKRGGAQTVDGPFALRYTVTCPGCVGLRTRTQDSGPRPRIGNSNVYCSPNFARRILPSPQHRPREVEVTQNHHIWKHSHVLPLFLRHYASHCTIVLDSTRLDLTRPTRRHNRSSTCLGLVCFCFCL